MECRSPRATVLSRAGIFATPGWCHSPPLFVLDGRRHHDSSQQNLNIKMIKTATHSVSCASKTPLVKDQVKKADKPIKEKKLTGVHAQKDRVAPAKTALAF